MQNMIQMIMPNQKIDLGMLAKGISSSEAELASFQSLLEQLGGLESLDGELLDEFSKWTMADLAAMAVPTDMPLVVTNTGVETSDSQDMRLTQVEGGALSAGSVESIMQRGITPVTDQTSDSGNKAANGLGARAAGVQAAPIKTGLEGETMQAMQPETYLEQVAGGNQMPSTLKTYINGEAKDLVANKTVKANSIKNKLAESVSQEVKLTSKAQPKGLNANGHSRIRDFGGLVQSKELETQKTNAKNNPFEALEKSMPVKAKVQNTEDSTSIQQISSEAIAKSNASATAPLKAPEQIVNVHEVRQAIETAVQKGVEKLSVKLKPEVLGGLVIEAIKGENGTRINIIADSFEGMEALRTKLPEIRTVMESSSGEFAGLDLSYSSDQGGAHKFEQQVPKYVRGLNPQPIQDQPIISSILANTAYSAQTGINILA